MIQKKAERLSRIPEVSEFVKNFEYMLFNNDKWEKRIFTVSSSKNEIIFQLKKGNIKVYVKHSLLSR